ncbi:MAG TPA: nuclear transport factor 2 family protein [Pseudomonadales bacterium]|nr:nuclear transport factor 2 family protein [Pseudomonadales bacterium]
MNQSNQQQAIISNLKRIYNQIDADHLDLLDQIYAPNIQFQDPFRSIQGLSALKNYFSEMYKNTSHTNFIFSGEASSGDTVFMEWRLTFSHPRLNGGKDIHVPGVSKLVLEEKITSHRDYFDSSQMLFEHIPLLRHPILWLKRSL